MNHSTTTSTGNAPRGDASSDSSAEVIRLLCPACTGGLNLQRRHIGIEGSCVHCHSPIRAAVRPNGEVFAEIPVKMVPPQSPPQEIAPPREEKPKPTSFAQIDTPELETPEKTGTRFPLPESTPDVKNKAPGTEEHASAPASHTPEVTADTGSANSPWGFPKPAQNRPAFSEPPPSAKPAAETSSTVSESHAPEPPAFESTPPSLDQVKPVIPEVPDTPFQPKEETAFGIPMAVESGAGIEEPNKASPFSPPRETLDSIANEKPVSSEAVVKENPHDSERKTVPPLFAQQKGSTSSSLFESEEEEESHAPPPLPPTEKPVSPFPPENREDEPAPGFAEALFPKKEPQQASPFSTEQAGPPALGQQQAQTPPPFGPPKTEEAADKLETKADPAPPASSPKPSRVFNEGSVSGTTAAITKIMRLVIVLTLLGGFAYAAFILTPPAKVAAMKVQIKEWLKPGAVLKEYLPFKVSIWEDEAPAPETTSEDQANPVIPESPAPAPEKAPPVSTEEKPEPEIPTRTPDPSVRPAPAVTPDQIAADVDPPE